MSSVSYVPIFTLLAVACFVVIYLIPTIVAISRKHLQKVPIILINILLGWSFIGWVVALVWACTKSKPKEVHIYNQGANVDLKEKIELLNKLHENGFVTDEELEQKKKDLLNDF